MNCEPGLTMPVPLTISCALATICRVALVRIPGWSNSSDGYRKSHGRRGLLKSVRPLFRDRAYPHEIQNIQPGRVQHLAHESKMSMNRFVITPVRIGKR
jgi:hypothetical protein